MEDGESGSYTRPAGKKDWGRPNKQHQPPCRINTVKIEEIRQLIKRERKRKRGKQNKTRERGKRAAKVLRCVGVLRQSRARLITSTK